MILSETTFLDVVLALIGVFGALATSGAAIAAAYFAHRAHTGVRDAAPITASTNAVVKAAAPMIESIDNAVNGRGVGVPTMSEDIATARARDEAQDSAAADETAPSAAGAADRAAGATSEDLPVDTPPPEQ